MLEEEAKETSYSCDYQAVPSTTHQTKQVTGLNSSWETDKECLCSEAHLGCGARAITDSVCSSDFPRNILEESPQQKALDFPVNVFPYVLYKTQQKVG